MKHLIMLFVVVVFFLGCNNKNKTVQEIPAAAMEEALENASVLQYNYANGNGTILKIEYSDYVRWIFRKHEQRAYNDRKLSILDKPNGTEIFSLGTDNYFNIVEMALEENLLDQGKKCWLKIKDDEEREGWVQGENRDPYADGLGSFVEMINIGNKDWTVIKLNERNLYAVNGLNLRDKPGLIDTRVLFQFNYNGHHCFSNDKRRRYC